MNKKQAKEADALLSFLLLHRGENFKMALITEETGLPIARIHSLTHLFGTKQYVGISGNCPDYGYAISGSGIEFINSGGYSGQLQQETRKNNWLIVGTIAAIVGAVAAIVAAITGIITVWK